jgi:DNA transformation protein
MARTPSRTSKRPAASKPSRPFAHLEVSASFRDYVVAQLEELGDVTPRAMFGGIGLYRRGVFFGIIAGDVLYFKVDDGNRLDYERKGAQPFRPYANRPSMKYFAVPVEILESAHDLAAWARKSLRAATRPSSD